MKPGIVSARWPTCAVAQSRSASPWRSTPRSLREFLRKAAAFFAKENA